MTLVSADKKMLSSPTGSWLKKPFTATITCYNEPVENNDTATCAWLLKTGTEVQKDSNDWKFFPPLKDIVPYQRIIWNETIFNQTFYVYDTAGNYDTTKSKVTINLGVDAFPPSVTMKSESALKKDGTVEVVLTATDSGSGLWPIAIKAQPVYKNATQAELKGIYGDNENCGESTPQYHPFPATWKDFLDRTTSRNSTPIKYNPLSQKIVYCVQDNAGNQLVGTYPFDPDALIGCFSDGSQQVVPNLNDADTPHYYKALLYNRIGQTVSEKNYGYTFTDTTMTPQMNTFHTKLTQNIETYVKQPYCPTTFANSGGFATMSVDIEERGTTEDPLRYAAQIKPTS